MRNESTVSKWGNSLAVRIPQGMARQARISEGDSLTLALQHDGSIILRSTRRRYDLEELVSRINPRNRHRETDWGPAVGKEVLAKLAPLLGY
jgi:antitoxin MazE